MAIAFTLSSELQAPPSTVWGVVATMSGVNDELPLWLSMTYPNGRHRIAEGGFTSWILFLHVVPLDRHRFGFERVSEGVFVERSSSLLNRRWEHSRFVTSSPGGSVLTDVLQVEPRAAVLSPFLGVAVRWVFRRRHARLRARFGAPDKGF